VFAAENSEGFPKPSTSPVEAAHSGHIGEVVLWGGPVLARTSDPNQTPCIEVIAEELERGTGRPEHAPGNTILTGQHFFACGAVLAGADFSKGHVVTIAGKLSALQQRDLVAPCVGLGGTVKTSAAATQAASVPVVDASDARSWPDLQKRGFGDSVLGCSGNAGN